MLNIELWRGNGMNRRCRAGSVVLTGCRTVTSSPNSTMSAGTVRFVLNRLML